MGKYSYLNLNQKMIKIRKKIPALIRKRYSEEVDYDFVKLDDINQFLTPALNRYGVDFDILREIPTQKDASGHTAFLIQDGNLWRYEANLEICWTNADHPDEKSISMVHLVGTNDVADKAKGTAMTYGLKYYLLNKFNISQNGDEDPDMRGIKPEKEPRQEKASSGKGDENKRPNVEEGREKERTGFVPQGSLSEGLGETPEYTDGRRTVSKALRSGNSVSPKAGNVTDGGNRNPKIQQMRESKDAAADSGKNPEKIPSSEKKENQDEDKFTEQTVRSFSYGQAADSAHEKDRKEDVSEPEEASRSIDEPKEEDIVFSDEDEPEEENKADEDAGDGFRSVKDEDEIPFTDEEEEIEADSDQSPDDKVEKAKAVVCNFGLFKGHTLGEMLETPKGWESLKWIAARYMGANKEMKEAARILVDADAYLPKAA